MKRVEVKIFPGLLLCLFLFTASYGAEQKELVVATKEAPPYAMKDVNQQWIGISIDLWKEIARELNLKYRFVETDLQGILDGLESNKFDAGVAALTVTRERESKFDFSHPFYITGLGIAVKKQPAGWGVVLNRFFSFEFLKIVLLLISILVIFGFVIWVAEKKKNAEQFSGTARGIGDGFWWAAVTMTTVGYGDKAPKTFLGRLISIIWMFTAIIIISSFTAAIASSLTVSELGSPIKGPEDLQRFKAASIKGSTSERYLKSNKIRYVNYETIEAALQEVTRGEIDCVVYDAPILQYYISKGDYKLSVLKRTFEQQYYSIGLVQNSPFREDINRVMLHKIKQSWWSDTIDRYIEPQS